jgi:predicted enzyme related to lactoylglutathione lyase
VANYQSHFRDALEDDCDAALAKATGLGAKALTPPIDIPGTGRFVTLQDPQGAAFAVIALEAPDN